MTDKHKDKDRPDYPLEPGDPVRYTGGGLVAWRVRVSGAPTLGKSRLPVWWLASAVASEDLTHPEDVEYVLEDGEAPPTPDDVLEGLFEEYDIPEPDVREAIRNLWPAVRIVLEMERASDGECNLPGWAWQEFWNGVAYGWMAAHGVSWEVPPEEMETDDSIEPPG